jgi:uncharacterized membrane protein YccC
VMPIWNLTYDRVRDRYLISDPGLFRLRSALRGTITVCVTTFALYTLSSYGHKPFLFALVGAMMAMNGALMGDDRTVREQKVTALLTPVISAVSLAFGVLLFPYRIPSIVVLLVFTFGAIFIRRYGVRWTTLGAISYTAYFAALFFKVPFDQMVFVVEGIVVAGLFSYGVKFWLVPDRAQSAIAWSLSAYRASLRRFVRAARRELAKASKLNGAAVRSRMLVVNQLAFLSEDAITNAADALPGSGALVRALQGRVFDLELGARRIYESFELRSRAETVAELNSLERGYSSLRAGEQALVAEEEAASPVVSTSTGIQGATVAGKTGIAKVRYSSLSERFHFQTRQAIQATVATLIATVVGTMISQDRWYWAPLTAYVVFTGTTRGDSLRRAFSRLAGTAFGVAAGLSIAWLLHGERDYEIAALFFGMFCAMFAIKVSYAWYVFWLTTVIAIFYSLLEVLTPSLLYLRIEQTLIGGICGGICAFFVLPISAKTSLRSELAKLIALLSNVLTEISFQRLTRRERRIRVRGLERELLTLRAIAGPLEGPLGKPARYETRLVVHGAAALVHFARQLIVFYPEDASTMRDQVHQLVKRTQALAERIPSTEFTDVKSIDGATLGTWALDPSPEQEAANYSLIRLSQAVTAFETRFPLNQ